MNKQTILKAYNGDTIAKTQTYNHYRKVLKSMLYGYNFDLDPSNTLNQRGLKQIQKSMLYQKILLNMKCSANRNV